MLVQVAPITGGAQAIAYHVAQVTVVWANRTGMLHTGASAKAEPMAMMRPNNGSLFSDEGFDKQKGSFCPD